MSEWRPPTPMCNAFPGTETEWQRYCETLLMRWQYLENSHAAQFPYAIQASAKQRCQPPAVLL